MKRLLLLAFACLALAGVTAASAAGAKPSKSFSAADEQYLKTSIEGDRFEIIGGKWAQTHTKNAAVLRMADRIVSDHTKSLKDAVKLARSLGIDVPSNPTPSEVWELKIVTGLRGRAYNHWYASLEVYDHVQDIQETTDEIKDGTNSQIRDDAKTELPMLQVHLSLARAALAANPTG
ncbi:MAG: DUF4142 domain-containing protein [Solirubrobacterales bacterium]|nr:DUF4142 domain-containing protein [Solirubrobacterales bacterium]